MNATAKLFLLLTVTIFVSLHSRTVQKQTCTPQLEEITLPSIRIAAPEQTLDNKNSSQPADPERSFGKHPLSRDKATLGRPAEGLRVPNPDKSPVNARAILPANGTAGQNLPSQP